MYKLLQAKNVMKEMLHKSKNHFYRKEDIGESKHLTCHK